MWPRQDRSLSGVSNGINARSVALASTRELTIPRDFPVQHSLPLGQKSAFFGERGNGITSRTFAMPVTY